MPDAVVLADIHLSEKHMQTPQNKESLQQALDQFTGTEKGYRHALVQALLYIEGAHFSLKKRKAIGCWIVSQPNIGPCWTGINTLIPAHPSGLASLTIFWIWGIG